MKKMHCILAAALLLCACDNGHLDLESREELVVEGWIEDGHAPVVLVSSTLPVSSDPTPLTEIQKHILRYAEVSIEHDGKTDYLTARLSEKFKIQNYFTSSTLRGEAGHSYSLHVKWQDYEATAVCTIPPSPQIDEAFFEKERNDTSYVLKIRFRNNPEEGRFYQSFLRVGSADTAAFRAVGFSALNGRLIREDVEESYMKPKIDKKTKDAYFHSGDVAAIKLATMEAEMYDFWTSFSNSYNSRGMLGSPKNLKGNVEGAIGYWAGYGVCVRELSIPNDRI